MTSSSTVADLLKNVQQLSEADFEDFFHKLLTLRKAHITGEVSDLELAILEEINKGLPTEKQTRFDLLIARRDAKAITEQEYQELLQLTGEVESLDLKRLRLIAQLAELRKISLAETVELFDIRPVSHG